MAPPRRVTKCIASISPLGALVGTLQRTFATLCRHPEQTPGSFTKSLSCVANGVTGGACYGDRMLAFLDAPAVRTALRLAAFATAALAASACTRCERGTQRHEHPRTSSAPSADVAHNPTGKPGLSSASRSPTSRPAIAAPALPHYNLSAPSLEDKLPAQLNEISGVTALSETELGCVEDETGRVFVFDLDKREIARRIRFGSRGDYEDLVRVGPDIYVLRSDGLMFRIHDFLSPNPSTTSQALGINAREIEALGFDAVEHRLLIAPKSRLAHAESGTLRVVFAFDVTTQKLAPDPAFAFGVDDIRDFVLRQGTKKKRANRDIPRFLPSAITVHPETGELFILSGVSHLLASLDRKGFVTGVAVLDATILPQPEGMTFLPNGDMIITSEGAGKRGRLLRFTLRP